MVPYKEIPGNQHPPLFFHSNTVIPPLLTYSSDNCDRRGQLHGHFSQKMSPELNDLTRETPHGIVLLQVMFGSGVNEGTGLQGALPVPVFEALNKQFGVTFECFASPLNSYFKQFCSAFPDIDGFFGSRG